MTNQPNFEIRNLARAFAGVSALYLAGIPLTLLASIVLARILSTQDFGQYGFAISLATVLSVPVTAGLPMLLTREISGYVRDGNWSSARGIIASSYAWVAAIAVLIVFGLGGWLFWSKSDTNGLLVVMVLVPFLGLAAIRNGILKGLAKPMLAEAPGQLLQPGALIAGFLALWYFDVASARTALWWYFTVVVIVFGVSTATLLWVRPDQLRDATTSKADMPRWLRALLPFAMLGGMTTLGAQIGVLLLGFFGMDEAVAFLRVAERGALLVAMPLAFINAVVGPYFVNAHRSGDQRALIRIARFSAWLALTPALPIALVLWLFGPWLIAATFGAPYDTLAYRPMMILVVAQMLSIALGNAGMLLSMGGHEMQTLLAMTISLAVTVTLAILLISPLGATGAAVAVAAGAVVFKLFAFLAVKREFGMSPGLF